MLVKRVMSSLSRYEAKDAKDKKKIARELTSIILQRKPKMSNFIEYRDQQVNIWTMRCFFITAAFPPKVVYKRYASLFFCFCCDKDDNELNMLEVIHR